MQILLFNSLLVVGGTIAYVKKAKFRFVRHLAVVYIFNSMIVSIGSWLFYCASIQNGLITKTLSSQINWISDVGFVMLGYLMVNILLALTSHESDENQVKKIIGLTLWAVTILTGFSFITESYWKAENFCKMTAFFNASGYNTWFLYFIMIAEGLGGAGLLLHSWLKTGPVAAAGLMLIMIGALYTHNHNNDPFSQSYPALKQFFILAIMQAIYYFEQVARPKPLNFIIPANN
jgi:uncharacterized membrane protein YphA (DoxX/SURF4 family)